MQTAGEYSTTKSRNVADVPGSVEEGGSQSSRSEQSVLENPW